VQEEIYGKLKASAVQLDQGGVPALLQNFHVESLSKITVESGRENQ